MSGAEQSVLDGAFGGVKKAGDGAQFHAVVVLQFENHSFSGREPAHSAEDGFTQLASDKATLGTGARAMVGHAVEDFFGLALGRNRCRDITVSRRPLAQMVETEIGHDAVNPGVERALETEAIQVGVGAQKGFLEDILAILLRPGEMNGEPQDGAVILTNQFFESGRVSLLRFTNENGVIDPGRTRDWQRSSWNG